MNRWALRLAECATFTRKINSARELLGEAGRWLSARVSKNYAHKIEAAVIKILTYYR